MRPMVSGYLLSPGISRESPSSKRIPEPGDHSYKRGRLGVYMKVSLLVHADAPCENTQKGQKMVDALMYTWITSQGTQHNPSFPIYSSVIRRGLEGLSGSSKWSSKDVVFRDA